VKRRLRIPAALLVSGLAVAYILYKIDFGKTAHILGAASVPWLLVSAALTVVTVPAMAWRWQQLLAVRGVEESVAWLTRTYFVSYAWGQILPTSVGGDAARIVETSRRHPGRITPVTGSILLERALGGAVTLLLAAVGFLLAIGRHYAIGAYLWPEAIFVVGIAGAGVVFFSRRIRRRLVFLLPLARRLRLETPARAVYDGIHGYRSHPRTLVVVAAVTAAAQLTRVLAIYASGRAVGIHLPVLPYVVLGPLLFLVLLVPSINGIGVREAFFVDFLGRLHVNADAAFACGFLFFVMTILLALPGVAVILWENVFGRREPLPSG
jgi:glycosyltransferase 2 family protein